MNLVYKQCREKTLAQYHSTLRDKKKKTHTLEDIRTQVAFWRPVRISDGTSPGYMIDGHSNDQIRLPSVWSGRRCGRHCQFLHTTVESWSCVSVREVWVRLEGAEAKWGPISRKCATARASAFMCVLMLNQVRACVFANGSEALLLYTERMFVLLCFCLSVHIWVLVP